MAHKVDLFAMLGIERPPSLYWARAKAEFVARVGEIRNRWQRSRKGYGFQDLWSFDQYLARLLSEALEEMADIAHGWPASEEFPTFESWTSELRRLAAVFKRYDEELFTFDDQEVQIYADVIDAMKRLGEMLPGIWD